MKYSWNNFTKSSHKMNQKLNPKKESFYWHSYLYNQLHHAIGLKQFHKIFGNFNSFLQKIDFEQSDKDF